MSAYIYNKLDQKHLRRELRKNESSVERLLWSKLRSRQLAGSKFRRQYGVGNFIVDFCCPSAKLIIEADGDSHFLDAATKLKDNSRQKEIEGLGFTVLRFTNKDITENIEGVLETILNHLRK